jgi:hypothetical protein
MIQFNVVIVDLLLKSSLLKANMTNPEIKLRDFESQILFFNGLYKLPVAPFPTSAYVIKDIRLKNPAITDDKDAVILRLKDFKNILVEEANEVDDIIGWFLLGSKPDKDNNYQPYGEIDFLTDMADWLGDIQVYCASEMAKFGLPLKQVLSTIMSSNFSKLDVNGNPIYDERGKVQKGPMYWKPEPKIKQILEEMVAETMEQQLR